jgi:hypothetical protein
MSRIHPEYPDPEASGRSVATDILLRQEPNDVEDEEEEEEEEEEDEGGEEDDDYDTDDGYSE